MCSMKFRRTSQWLPGSVPQSGDIIALAIAVAITEWLAVIGADAGGKGKHCPAAAFQAASLMRIRASLRMRS
jgi:hypothetical protein